MSGDAPTRLERLAAAVNTSNLTFDPDRRMPLDQVVALGLASRASDVTSNILRLHLARTPEAWNAAMESTLGVVRRLNNRRGWGLGEHDMSVVSRQAILLHINPTCSHCHGQGYRLIPGTPTLSHHPCPHCKGSGRRQPGKRLRGPIEATIASIEHIDAITEQAVGKYLK